MRISRENRTCRGEIKLPASKSISNRLLILHFVYGNSLSVSNLSTADDTVLLSSLLDLIRQYQSRGDTGLLRLDARNAGTVMRFLIPLLSVTKGHFLLTGTERMKQRPIGALVEAMRETGAEIDYLEQKGYPPLFIRGRAITGQRIRIDASSSSQFVTALLLLAPTLEDGLTVELTGTRASWPYVKMTTGILSYLGIQVVAQDDAIRVFHKKEIKINIEVESDWSAASFWYCMLSMADEGEVFFNGLRKSGLQGDQQLVNFFRQLGVITVEDDHGLRIEKGGEMSDDFHADFTAYPDLALPVILACGAAGINATFTGLDRLRLKESDRLTALSEGLLKSGILLREEYPGAWRLSGHMIHPCDLFLDDFEDHRVAMTFACLAMKGFTVHLDHPEVVNKSYPGFWKDLEAIGFSCDPSC
ncbi:MAG: 3-phosphoshikimate 1-carboxyvinyltransferase [Bacteroidales bacterium]|nr:3-phosphoshikimate 1-carboxyvinyltransferase [Bacteroidales bacterium]